MDADDTLSTFADRGALQAKQGLLQITEQATATGEELSTTFDTQIGEARTALLNFGNQAMTTKGQLLNLQTQETTTGEFTSGAFATDVKAGTLALDSEATSARGAAGNMSDLALAEDGAAASAAGTAGAGGLSGALGSLGGALSSVLGPLMLVIAAEQTLGPLMDNMAKSLTGNPNLPNIFEMNTFQLFATEFQAFMNLINNMGPHDAGEQWKQAAESAKEAAAEMAQAALDAAAKMKQAEEEAYQKYLADLYNAEHATKEVFAGIGNAATDGMNAVKKSIQDTFAGLPGEATLWGLNVTASFAQGMLNYAGQVDNAANNLMNRVHKYLGVESPTEEGPGQRLMEWGPNLTREFAAGMLSQIGLVGNAASAIMQQAKQGLTGSVYTGGISAASSASSAQNLSMSRVETLLEQLVAQGYRMPPLGAQPVNTTTGSVLSINNPQFNGMGLGNLQSLYNEMNMLAGLYVEYAGRGAING